MKFLQNFFTQGSTSPKQANAYKNGMHYYNQADYQTAVIFFKHVLGKKNRSRSLEQNLAKFYCERAYANLGLSHFIHHENSRALGYFEKAVQLNPNDADLNYFIGICLNNVGRYDEAMIYFSKIPSHETLDVPNKLKLSIIFYNLGMWKTAESIQKTILISHQEFADAHFHLGLALISQGKTAASADAFKTALSINPDYTHARFKLSIAQISMGAYDGAAKNLHMILDVHPNYADAYYLLGIIRDRQDKTREGIHFLDKALNASPTFKNALIKRIIFYCRLGEPENAENAYQEAEKYYPGDKRLTTIKKHLNLFQASAPKEELPEALDVILKDEYSLKALKNEFHGHLDILPSFSEIITMFSNSKYAQNDASIPNFLIPLILEALEKNPEYPDLYNSLGRQYMLCRKYEQAKTAFSRAIDLHPDYVQARINLFKTLYKNRQYEQAYEEGKILLAKNVQFPDIYYNLAKILMKLGNYAEALKNAEAVLRFGTAMRKTMILVAQIHICLGDTHTAKKVLSSYLEVETDEKNAAEARQMLQNLTPKRGDLVMLSMLCTFADTEMKC